MPNRLARMLLARSVRTSANKAGVPVFLASAAFNMLLRRSPAGAFTLGAALLAHRAYRAGQNARIRRAARKGS